MNLQDIENALSKASQYLSEAKPLIQSVATFINPAVGMAVNAAAGILDATLPVLAKLKNNEIPTDAEWAALDAATKSDSDAIQQQVKQVEADSASDAKPSG